MTVEIAAEDHKVLEQLVHSGRFNSMAEAVHGLVQQLAGEASPDEEWKRQLDAGIEEGLADVAAGRYRPARELLAELHARFEN